MDDLSGKHALVCGASTGIGRAAAMALARRGATITVLARNRAKLDALAPQLLVAGAPDVHVLVANLDERPALRDALVEHLQNGPMHILVNNTGGPPSGALLEQDEEAAFLVPFGRHVLASQQLLRQLLPGMRKDGYGRIVNVISTSVREPIPALGISNIVRAAMASWAKTISHELPPGITINSVLPGYTDTERLDALRTAVAKRTGKKEDAIQKEWLEQVPEGRLATAEELGEAVAWLASPAAAFVRGVCLAVDGGRMRSI